jgi:class 3 adenylate cyclase
MPSKTRLNHDLARIATSPFDLPAVRAQVAHGAGGTQLLSAAGLASGAPAVHWLSETVHSHVQASFDALRMGLRVARERVRDGLPASARRSALTTLLATDLEGFTPIVERLGDASAQRLIRVHNELLRGCLRRYRGREVAHTGDGILASFRCAARASQCAIAMQRALDEHNLRQPDTLLRVRIGLHAGLPLPEEKRLFGSCVNITVRVCATTRPGRVLISDTVRGLIDGCMFECEDRGWVRLKGISAPLHVHELRWIPTLCDRQALH